MANTDQSPSLLYAVKRLELAIRSRLDEMLRDAGVTTLQYTALTVLAHRDSVSAAQLARDSFVTPQSMADMLRLLQGRGLIQRAANPESRRELLVHITDEGRSFLRTYAAEVRSIEKRMTDSFSADDVGLFSDVLHGMWQALR